MIPATLPLIAIATMLLHVPYYCYAMIMPNNTSNDNTNTNNISNNIDNNNIDNNKHKRLILIRHGCTYANEYLAQPGLQWGDPTFRDVPELRDSPLSPRGIHQAMGLRQKIADQNIMDTGMIIDMDMIGEIDLVVVSPLSRTLQTFELALLPEIMRHSNNNNDYNNSNNDNNDNIPNIIALPLARERLYMISDMGLTTSELKVKFPWADFDSEFKTKSEQTTWWYTPTREQHSSNDDDDDDDDDDNEWKNYKEWRPHGQGQQYLVPGEPDDAFEERMIALSEWLGRRSEQTIAVICHWGVLEWLTGQDFENCEVKVVDYDKIAASIRTKTKCSIAAE